MIGGLSLGAQILVEILAQRPDICKYAVIESASVIPSRVTHALIGPTFSSSYGLIRQEWFAKMQFRYLRMRDDLFEDYFRDTAKITKENMICSRKTRPIQPSRLINGSLSLRARISRVTAGPLNSAPRSAFPAKYSQPMVRAAAVLMRMITP